MGNSSILLANEPRAYRETMAVAIGMLCPDKTVIVAEPERLDEFIIEHLPDVVLCSHLTATLESNVATWAVLYPDGSGETVIQIDGQRQTILEIQLNGIVRLIQQADTSVGA